MVEIGNITKLEIKDLAERCVVDASKSTIEFGRIVGFGPDSCNEFLERHLKENAGVEVISLQQVWNEGWGEHTDPGRMDAAWRSKMLKKALKELFPETVFSVRLQRYSCGNSIDIHWKDGPATRTVERTGLKNTFSSVDRDRITGEILSGGNSFVFNERKYSDEMRKWAKDHIKEQFGIDDETLEFDNRYNSEMWQLLQRTDFSKDPPIILEK